MRFAQDKSWSSESKKSLLILPFLSPGNGGTEGGVKTIERDKRRRSQ